MTYTGIAGLSGSGTAGYFTDSLGNPKLLVLEMAWGLPCNAGRWNGSGGGTWQQDIDNYFAARSAQGFTAWWGVPWINVQIDPGAVFGDGRTWDGIYPLTLNGTPGTIATGSETVALNDPFWQRTDYLITSALNAGMAVFLNMGMQYDFSGSGTRIFTNLSSTQAHAIGAAIATRYPQSAYPNLHWAFGDDCDLFTAGAITADAAFTQILSGMVSAGDARTIITMEQTGETDSHIRFDTGVIYHTSGFGIGNTTVNFCYSYQPSYLGVEGSYKTSVTPLLPVVQGDGPWYGDTDNATVDYTMRRMMWQALASGARGIDSTSGPSAQALGLLWTWQASATALLTSDSNGAWCTSAIGTVTAYFTSLLGWYKLIPDTSNLLVTAGRGTRASNIAPGFGSTNYGDSDTYVCASRAPDGSLAVIYCAAHFSITIDQTKMLAGYGAKWVDPWTCAATTAATGSTYNSTPLGNNSKGDPDWVLVLASPPYATWTI
jgi:hypothetical protein